MKLGELILIVFFLLVGLGLVAYYFSDYLFARVIGQTNETITVKQGQALNIEVGSIKSSSTVKTQICGGGAGGRSCFPLTVHARRSPVFTRIPIGYPTGPAVIQAVEETNNQGERLLFSISVKVER